jgi:hypothetical protein
MAPSVGQGYLFAAIRCRLWKIIPHAKEVLRYREALWHGMESIKKRPVFSTNLAIEIVNTIKEHNAWHAQVARHQDQKSDHWRNRLHSAGRRGPDS